MVRFTFPCSAVGSEFDNMHCNGGVVNLNPEQATLSNSYKIDLSLLLSPVRQLSVTDKVCIHLVLIKA